MEKIITLIVGMVSLGLGFFIYREPVRTIGIQKKFYAMINWRMEPISLDKEIRNTKIMGFFLIVFVFVVLACSLLISFSFNKGE